MARVIVIANQKGGVGKTTTSVNLSAALALQGAKTLVIDIDPQGNATSGLGIEKDGLEATLYEVFQGVFSLSSVIAACQQELLWVAPASNDLVGIDIELSDSEGRELVLKEQIGQLSDNFDFILIDCPPSLNILTINALVAADSLLVPLQCEYYALEGISALMQTVTLAREELNPDLFLEGVLLTMYDGRTKLARQVVNEAKAFFGHSVFNTVIPRNVRLGESPSFGMPIFSYDKSSPGALAYYALAEELQQRIVERSSVWKGKKKRVGE